MIIYGSRMYFRSNVVNTFGDCQYCGVYGKQTSYQAKKFGHIYFIPLIPMGSKSQVMDECRRCNMGAHLPTTELEPRREAIRERFKSWITQLTEGNSEIQMDGMDEPISAGILISSMLHDLYCLKEIESIDSIRDILLANDMQFDSHIVEGFWYQLTGDLQAARSSFMAACQMKPEETVPYFQLGKVALHDNNPVEAEQAFRKYLALAPDDLSGYIELASMFEAQKDFPKIVETYDQIYAMRADLVPDKGMKKIYKKACKKSGMQGKFLDQM